jgi:pimeloyl-ACP methyl ester carboxylesterase
MLRQTHPLFVWLLAAACAACCQSPTMLPPESGYGSWGSFAFAADSLPHPEDRNSYVYLFSPQGAGRPPVILFCPGIMATNPRTYMALIRFLVSKGLAVVYSPYQTASAYARPPDAYYQMWSGIEGAMAIWGERLDTAYVGVIGHSYGGGAVPYIARKALMERKWGGAGAFLFIMAPWYSYETFGMSAREKDFVVLYSDTTRSDTLVADHGVPTGESKFGSHVDMLDYYGVHRLVDALAHYAFTGSEPAKRIALGNGSPEQRFMGMWSKLDSVRQLSAGDTPPLAHPQSYYTNFWSHRVNPRAFMHQDSGRVDNGQTWRNYLRSPRYKRILEEEKEQGEAGDREEDEGGMDEEELLCYIPPPAEGYGAEGPYQPLERFFPHPGKGDANVHVIIPHGADTLLPVVLFAPALWKPSTTFYRGLIDHIVSRGTVVVFSTYNFRRFCDQKLRYRVLLEGFEAGLELVRDQIDTTRLAVVGHSYGGGAVPAVAWEYMVNKRWGSKGTALLVMAPWYVFNMTQEQFERFPSHAKLVVQTYEGDRKMDWRIAQDIFYNLPIHPTEKDYIYIRDAESRDCEFDADHDAPQSEDRDETNVIDFYGIYRILDALMDYSFSGSADAKVVALGNGSKEQLFMDYWHDATPVEAMRVSDRPKCPHRQRAFMFRWKDRMNPRRRLYQPDD